MLRRKLTVAALAVSSLLGLSTVAAARDRDDYRYSNRGYYGGWNNRGMSAHELHEMEEHRAREAREAARLQELEQRRAMRNGYYNPSYGGYNNGYRNNGYRNNGYGNNGYYDRFGVWHSYGW